ncbi:MAG TPA: 2-phospho-L-lactate guanylyltransferase [Candidatus Acidoferrales bacterium]|nr:2-phospho-L-lactate guanylyltransferase [Candidatus Acidoferrales bacterium]
MKAILIPVKEFREAKKRLTPHFSSAERAALAEAMCEDFFQVVSAIRCVERVFVVSKEPGALALARERGWEAIVEKRQISESDSVDAASQFCAAQGVNALLRLPIDLPLAEPRDIEAVFRELDEKFDGNFDGAPAAVLVPSRDGAGTNALLRTPPGLFPSRFGPNSFALHLAEAARCGARICVLRNARLELDVDELEDLRGVHMHLRPGSATARWCNGHNIGNLGSSGAVTPDFSGERESEGR